MCSNPRLIHRPDGSTMLVGCGHCLQCLKAYQDSWTARLNEELKSWSPVVQDGKLLAPVIFYTLDYRPEAIPCSYLVVTELGVRVQDVRPDCPIYEFWTDTRRETQDDWLVRRKDMIDLYHRFVQISSCADDIPMFPRELPFFKFQDCSRFEHPSFEYDVVLDASGFGRPLVAFEFHTVRKSDVQKWNKRGRINLSRRFPEIFDQAVNPRFNPFWRDCDGVDHELPTCALPKNVKSFITSEYGPLTHRPHYHGVIFGVTYEEFRDCFADDWNKNFGRCEFSVMRPSGGALTYLSKYCSKGSYEHPYCCKDFIYPDGSEFHSDSYSNCITDFGIDLPLVAPTFHLISKGIGANYAFSAEVQNYFGVKLTEYILDSGRLKYSCSEISSLPRPSVSLDKLLCLNDGSSMLESCDVSFCNNGDILVRRYDQRKNIIGESLIKADSVVNCAIEELQQKLIYSRSYVKQSYQNKLVPGRCLPCWHLIGLDRLCNPKTFVTTLSLPRYYRNWLVSPLASLLRQSASIRLHPSSHDIVAGLVQSGRSSDQAALYVRSLLASEEDRNKITSLRLWKSSLDFYAPHGFKNLE